MEKIGMEGGIIAIKNIDPYDFLGSKPPLGTRDEDGNYTSESTTDLCDIGNYKKSQAFMGIFELLYGKTAFSLSIDQESSDSNDITSGRDKVKGYQNITGSFDLEMLLNDNRISGAVKGKWHPDKRGYDWNSYFRDYEIWVAINPNSRCGATMTECDKLYKLIGCRLERSEMEAGQPNKGKLPFFAKLVQEFPEWKASDWTPQEVYSGPSVAGAVSLDSTIQEMLQTRLAIDLTSATGLGQLTITGCNLLGELVVESVDLSDATLIQNDVYITKNYFSSVKANGVVFATGWGGTVTIDEYDTVLFP